MASPRARRMRRALRLKALRGTTTAPVVAPVAEEAPAAEAEEEVVETAKIPRGLSVSKSGAKKSTKKTNKKTSAKASNTA